MLDFMAIDKKKPYFRLASKKRRLRWAKVHRHWKTGKRCCEQMSRELTGEIIYFSSFSFSSLASC